MNFMSFSLSSKKKYILFFTLLGLLGSFFYFDLHSYIQFDSLLREKERLLSFYHNRPLLFGLFFLVFYIVYATFSLPGASLLTLAAGFIFQFVIGSLIVILGSVTGAVFCFLISRFFLRDYLQNKFQSRFDSINKGFEKDGFFYLLSLRLIPAIPFFVVNVFMGLTSISVKHYTLGTFLGMLPAIFLYVNAGQQLAELESAKDILSFPILISFLFLALLPWILKYFVNFFRLKQRP